MSDELRQLHARGFIESAEIPDLGPLPASSPAEAGEAGSGSEVGSDDEDDEDGEDSESNASEEEEEPAEDDEDEYAERGKGTPTNVGRRTTRRSTVNKAESLSGEIDKKDPSTNSSDATPKPEGNIPAKRKRGRPPKIDTPEEARIRSILRAIRKVKDTDGRHLFLEFEKLPDPTQYPDYYTEIKRPVALDNITVYTTNFV